MFSTLDTKILCLQRFIRLFAFGASTLILASYLGALGTSDDLIGLFMTLTLIGDVFISFLLALVADKLGRRNILGLGALLMCGSGVVFATFGNYWILLVAAILGVITPRYGPYGHCCSANADFMISGNEIGPFRAVEESTIAHLNAPEHRSQVFAWYTLIGMGGVASGLNTCGWVTTYLVETKHWSHLETYRVMFLGYAAIGALKFLLTLLLSAECEAEPAQHKPKDRQDETAPLLRQENEEQTNAPPKESKPGLWSSISPESRAIVFRLCILFAFDNFASGLAPMSWVTYYFKRQFGISDGQLGTIFSSTSLVSAISVLFAASLARRIGNVKTMVFTHLPSSICLALIGIPTSFPLAVTLLVLRASTQSMDAAPRSAFLAAVVQPHERTAVMGIVNVVKTASQSMGPFITGVLVKHQLFWVAFLMAGSLKAAYDLGLLVTFVGQQAQERRKQTSEEERSEGA